VQLNPSSNSATSKAPAEVSRACSVSSAVFLFEVGEKKERSDEEAEESGLIEEIERSEFPRISADKRLAISPVVIFKEILLQ